MHPVALWAVLIGLLLIAMAFSSSQLKRLPLSGAMVYLLVGYGLGSAGWQLFNPNPYEHSRILERVAEATVVISLFCAGLKLQVPLHDASWRVSLRLATITMLVTIALLAAVGQLFGLSLGAALVLAAILAPTDPVLASDVQVENAHDTDKLRFSLTGESGLNDGTVLPFVLLGLALLNAPASVDIWHWLARDVVWSIGSGIGIGALCGNLIGRLVIYLRTEQKEAVGLDEFLVLGLIALAYGAALLAYASTFLAVFAAAVALTHTTRRREQSPKLPTYDLEKLDELATSRQHAGPLMVRAVLGFNEQLERIAEVTVVILVGALIPFIELDAMVVGITAVLIFVIRPLAIALTLRGSKINRAQRLLIAWFGVRGIGSIYYLFYVLNRQLPIEEAELFVSVTLSVVVTSIVAHGVSVTPLMRAYARRKQRKAV